jgi:hypothetical protein
MVPIEKVARQLQDIVSSRTEWRDLHIDPVEPVVQIQPESAMLDELGKRTVGGDNEPRVDVTGAAAADALDREVLNRAEDDRKY